MDTMPKKSQANKIEQDTKASEAAASSACLSRPDVTEAAADVQQVILIKQELLEKINKKTTETQTELCSSIKKLNKRPDKVESHTSELDNGVTANSGPVPIPTLHPTPLYEVFTLYKCM
ncbi:hypothetical protein GOODEAATRI_028650 [Goodea atripinnis]|uniref:Uncharacterized protein n=1 Tax=Goodea atripinnis TaxID=208336 RepID=A0ABV0P1A4_9TELE